MKKHDIDLLEITGAFTHGIQTNVDQQTIQLMQLSVLPPPIPHTPYEWQSIIIQNLERQDVLVTGATGGGKSLPVLAHWLRRYGYNNPTAPVDITTVSTAILEEREITQGMKLLWLTPFRALNESIINDISQVLSRVVTYGVLKLLYSYIQERRVSGDRPPTQAEIIESLNNLLLENDKYRQTLGNRRVVRYTRNLIDFIGGLNINNPALLIQIMQSEILQMLCQAYISNVLVGNIYEGTDTSNIEGSDKRKPIVVAIYESASNLNIKPSDNILVVFDEIQILVVPRDNKDPSRKERAEQVGLACSKILLKLSGAGRLVLLSGTLDPSNAVEIADIVKTYDRPSMSCPDIRGKNPASIEVKSMDQLNNQNLVVKLIVDLLQLGKTNIAILIFSKDKIADVTKKVLRELQTKSVKQVNHPDISRIGDPLLKTAAIYGLGYIVRKTSSDPFFGIFGAEGQEMLKMSKDQIWNMIQNDNIIMQNLFVNKFIRVLLVTDSIEAGVNLNINEMYITKFEKSGDQSLTDVSKAQILNRVGRQPMTATIYAPTKYVPDIKRILSGGGKYFGTVHLPRKYPQN